MANASDEFGPQSFTGEGVIYYQALALASGLDLYAKTGMKPNRAWSPTNMLKTANQLTGHHYTRSNYGAAAAALREYAASLLRGHIAAVRAA